MRILHVVPSYLPARRYGGPIYSVHGLCKALVERGHEVHVFTTNVDGPGDSDVPLHRPVPLDGVQVWYFPCRHLRRLFWSPPMARALHREVAGFDVVHLHSIFLWPTWAAARAARRRGVPYVLAPRGMLVRDLIHRKSRWVKLAWIKLIERNNIEKAALLHLTSPVEERELAQFPFRWPTIVQIPNGIDPPPPTPDFHMASPVVRSALAHRPSVLFLSRIHWKKGIDRLIRALTHIPSARLVVAGNDEEDYLPELRKLTGQLALDERVHFLGPVHDIDKEVLLRHAALLVLPSVYPENFGNVVLEGMIRHCPVVITPQVGLAEWIASADAGTVVGGDSQTLAEAISRCLAQPRQTRAMAARAATAVTRFTWSNVAMEMESAYRRIPVPIPTALRYDDHR